MTQKSRDMQKVLRRLCDIKDNHARGAHITQGDVDDYTENLSELIKYLEEGRPTERTRYSLPGQCDHIWSEEPVVDIRRQCKYCGKIESFYG